MTITMTVIMIIMRMVMIRRITSLLRISPQRESDLAKIDAAD